MKNPPLKRHKALQNLSREHHDSLVFVLRLQKGIPKNAKMNLMQDYIKWYWKSHLNDHFNMEEKYLFPRYGMESKLVERALEEHKAITKLVQKQPKSYAHISALCDQLKAHIRFEERVLFMRIQEEFTREQLKEFSQIHTKQIDCGLWINRFWK